MVDTANPDEPLSDAEADALLLSLGERLLEAQRSGTRQVAVPRHELMLALGLAAKFRELVDAVDHGCEGFVLRDVLFERVHREDA